MALIQSTAISNADDYEIEQSLRFSGDAGGEPKLTWTPSSNPTSSKKHTVSFWVKRGELEAYSAVISAGGRFDTAIYFNAGASNKDTVTVMTNYAEVGRAIEIEPVLRETSAFYHIVATWDTNNATSTDRHICWVNGVRQTVGAEASMPQNGSTKLMANSQEITIGMGGRYQHENRFDGYLSEFHCIDGQVLTPSSFGETGTYGEWKPIEYEGTYGTNGFYLDFADSSNLGDDKSGNGNDFAVNDITASDQMLDTPTNNFCTLNPLDTIGSPTISEGNLKSSHGNDIECRSTMHMSSGKWYWENCVTGGSYGMLGMSKSGSVVINYNDSSEGGVAYYQFSGSKYIPGDGSGGISYGASYTTGDIISIAYNADDNEITFYKNNVSQGTITSIPDKVYTPSVNSATSYTGVINFGQDSSFAGNKTAQGNQDGNSIGDFYYTPPTGFLALCTSNLPAVDVVPSEHFNTLLYTGNGSTNAITGVGFQPDFTWIKGRDVSVNHFLFDAVRGVTKWLKGDTTGVEGTNANGLTTFGSDGFTVGSEADSNTSSQNYVAWNWKANGSGSSNTNGSITSTVSANVDAGFSIVSYTGNGSAATVGHGLSKAPEMITVKNRENARNWRTYHKYSGASDPETDYLNLDETGAVADYVSWNDTAPTSSVFSITSSSDRAVNYNGETFIAYAFHSVDGYSKVGSYKGNGNADGTFVYTGFRPAYVMIKPSSRSGHWMVANNKSSPSNVVDKVIFANASAGEYTDPNADCKKDFFSNGFKIRTTDDNTNESGATYIYLAFAETPFKYSNAR